MPRHTKPDYLMGMGATLGASSNKRKRNPAQLLRFQRLFDSPPPPQDRKRLRETAAFFCFRKAAGVGAISGLQCWRCEVARQRERPRLLPQERPMGASFWLVSQSERRARAHGALLREQEARGGDAAPTDPCIHAKGLRFPAALACCDRLLPLRTCRSSPADRSGPIRRIPGDDPCCRRKSGRPHWSGCWPGTAGTTH